MKWKKENKTKGEPGSGDGDTEISPQTSPQGWKSSEKWNFLSISLRVVYTLFPATTSFPPQTWILINDLQIIPVSNDAYFVVLIMLLVPKKKKNEADKGEEVIKGTVNALDDE